MAHNKQSQLGGIVVGDEEGGSWQRCQANCDKRDVTLVMGKSKDQRMPLGRSTGPKPELPGFGKIFPYPNQAVV